MSFIFSDFPQFSSNDFPKTDFLDFLLNVKKWGYVCFRELKQSKHRCKGPKYSFSSFSRFSVKQFFRKKASCEACFKSDFPDEKSDFPKKKNYARL